MGKCPYRTTLSPATQHTAAMVATHRQAAVGACHDQKNVGEAAGQPVHCTVGWSLLGNLTQASQAHAGCGQGDQDIYTHSLVTSGEQSSSTLYITYSTHHMIYM